MYTPGNTPDDSPTSGYPTPFYKSRTMPDGWDLSNQPSWEIANPPAGSANSTGQNAGEEGYLPNGNDRDQAQKFIQPRTIPKDWDTSALK